MEIKRRRPKRKKIQVSFSHSKGAIVFQGLQHEEVDMFLKMLEGTGYIIGAGKQTRIMFTSRFEKLTQNVTDKEMLPYWRSAEVTMKARPVQLRFPFMFDTDTLHGEKIGLYVQDICGFSYTEGKYIEAAKLLEMCAFQCLRSKRDMKKGTFTEMWYLSDLELAKGRLAIELSTCTTQYEKLHKAINFIDTCVSPKRIDVVKK